MTMTPDLPPQVSEEMLITLRAERDKLPQIKANIDRAKTAGIDVTQEEADYTEAANRIHKLLAVYDTA